MSKQTWPPSTHSSWGKVCCCFWNTLFPTPIATGNNLVREARCLPYLTGGDTEAQGRPLVSGDRVPPRCLLFRVGDPESLSSFLSLSQRGAGKQHCWGEGSSWPRKQFRSQAGEHPMGASSPCARGPGDL